MRLSPLQVEILKSLIDGEWHTQDASGVNASVGVYRRMAKAGVIERDPARGAMYGITHDTRIRITPIGRVALRRYWP